MSSEIIPDVHTETAGLDGIERDLVDRGVFEPLAEEPPDERAWLAQDVASLAECCFGAAEDPDALDDGELERYRERLKGWFVVPPAGRPLQREPELRRAWILEGGRRVGTVALSCPRSLMRCWCSRARSPGRRSVPNGDFLRVHAEIPVDLMVDRSYFRRVTTTAKQRVACESADAATDVCDESAGDRLRAALDLFDLSLRMFRHRLVREGLQPADVDARVEAWLACRPGAESGDAMGRPRSWPRE